jgi:hypothetical protein
MLHLVQLALAGFPIPHGTADEPRLSSTGLPSSNAANILIAWWQVD